MNYYAALVSLNAAELERLPSKTEREMEESFQEFINEVIPPVTVLGGEYEAYFALTKLDPIALHQEFLAWLSNEEYEEHGGLYYRRSDIADFMLEKDS